MVFAQDMNDTIVKNIAEISIQINLLAWRSKDKTYPITKCSHSSRRGRQIRKIECKWGISFCFCNSSLLIFLTSMVIVQRQYVARNLISTAIPSFLRLVPDFLLLHAMYYTPGFFIFSYVKHPVLYLFSVVSIYPKMMDGKHRVGASITWWSWSEYLKFTLKS